jgi:hypothetical protein
MGMSFGYGPAKDRMEQVGDEDIREYKNVQS